jgi:NADH-quinone oxidoreductase subunit E
MSELPAELRESLEKLVAASEHPEEQVINVMYALQGHYGYLSDEAVGDAAALLGMTPLQIEELATFYDFIYREPVGKFVIHVCDGVVCWMFHEYTVFDYLCKKLEVCAGQMTKDGMFTVLPTACLGFCDRAPAMLINGVTYGPVNREMIDEILEKLRTEYCDIVVCK